MPTSLPGEYEQALICYRTASQLGQNLLPELNAAHILEQQGYFLESKQMYLDCLDRALTNGEPSRPVKWLGGLCLIEI